MPAQRHHGANRHAFTHLKRRNRLLGLGHHRLLPADLAQVADQRVQPLGVLRGFTHAHVHHDLMQPRDSHRIGRAQFLGQRRSNLFIEFVFQPCRNFCGCHCFSVFLLPRFRGGYRFVGSSILGSVFSTWYLAVSSQLLRFNQHCIVFQTRPNTNYQLLSTASSYLSNGDSQRRQILTCRLPCILCPIRDGPQLGQTTITLEMEIGDSCSAIPPLMLRCGLGRTFFFTIITCSTSTLLVPGNTRSTRPCLPLSRPVITFTVSLRLMSTLVCIVCLQPLAALLLLSAGKILPCASLASSLTGLPAPEKQSSKTSFLSA